MYNYFIELKNRFLLLLLTWCSLFLCSYYYKEVIIFDLVYKNSCFEVTFVFLTFSEVFHSFIRISFFTANQVTFPVVLYHFFLFFGLALSRKEFFVFKKFLSSLLFCWWCGILVLYIYLASFLFSFVFQFFSSLKLNFYFELKLFDCLIFLVFLINYSLYCFQICNIMFFTFLMLKVPLLTIKKFRKLFYFLFGVCFFLLVPLFDLSFQIFLFLGFLCFVECIIIFCSFTLFLIKVKD